MVRGCFFVSVRYTRRRVGGKSALTSRPLAERASLALVQLRKPTLHPTIELTLRPDILKASVAGRLQ